MPCVALAWAWFSAGERSRGTVPRRCRESERAGGGHHRDSKRSRLPPPRAPPPTTLLPLPPPRCGGERMGKPEEGGEGAGGAEGTAWGCQAGKIVNTLDRAHR